MTGGRKKIDPALQAQVDAQLMEQGAFSPLDLLIDTGRLAYADYESWRRKEIDSLDEVLMGAPARIRAQLEDAAGYARSIGLVEQRQDLYAWRDGASGGTDEPLRISADPALSRLIGCRYVPAQSAPQMDLFFDNPVVALTNGIVRALSDRDAAEAQRLLDQLYARAPNHADLAAFDQLLTALHRSNAQVADGETGDPHDQLAFLLGTLPVARRLLGPRSRDLLRPLWLRLADTLGNRPFSPDEPELHRSFALAQAHDWSAVREAVLAEPDWQRHAQLCMRLAESAFYRRDRAESLSAWCHACWHAPEEAARAIEERRQPDAGITALWQAFVDSTEALSGPDDPAPSAVDFPAWLLLREPGLALQLPLDLPTGKTPAEEAYRCTHRWIHARRNGHSDEEMALRRKLQAMHPLLFRYLKQTL